MVKKIKEWLYFNYNLDIPVNFIWLIIILFFSILLLSSLMLLSYNPSKGVKFDPGNDPMKRVQISGTKPR